MLMLEIDEMMRPIVWFSENRSIEIQNFEKKIVEKTRVIKKNCGKKLHDNKEYCTVKIISEVKKKRNNKEKKTGLLKNNFPYFVLLIAFLISKNNFSYFQEYFSFFILNYFPPSKNNFCYS
jgi:hypothetical protein